jgi:hypothetical protein
VSAPSPESSRIVARAVKPAGEGGAPGAGEPEVLVVEPTAPAGATLVRYSAGGSVTSETWYLTAEEAQACALRDYGAGLGPWRELPAEVRDPVAFALGGA